MNVTWLPSGTMMSFGVATLFWIVMVVVFTAPAGVVVGVTGDATARPGCCRRCCCSRRTRPASAPARTPR